MSWKQVAICLVISLCFALGSFGWLFVMAFGSGEILTIGKFLEVSSDFTKRGDISGLIFLSGSFAVVIPVLLASLLLDSLGIKSNFWELPLVILVTALVVFIPLCGFFFIKNRMK